MRFVSTRGESDPVGFSEAVAQGLAPDGGLYLPESFPDLGAFPEQWEGLAYPELCFEFFSLFATDVDAKVLRRVIERSYSTFSHSQIAPMVELSENCKVLELFHGPTLAFKDFACNSSETFTSTRSQNRKEPDVWEPLPGYRGGRDFGLIGKRGSPFYSLPQW